LDQQGLAEYCCRAMYEVLGGLQVAERMPVPSRAGVRVKNVRVNAFPLVAALFWLRLLSPDGNTQVSAMRPVPSPRSVRLKCTVTTLVSRLQIRRAPRAPWLSMKCRGCHVVCGA
jgi:hypothetical protein